MFEGIYHLNYQHYSTCGGEIVTRRAARVDQEKRCSAVSNQVKTKKTQRISQNARRIVENICRFRKKINEVAKKKGKIAI